MIFLHSSFLIRLPSSALIWVTCQNKPNNIVEDEVLVNEKILVCLQRPNGYVTDGISTNMRFSDPTVSVLSTAAGQLLFSMLLLCYYHCPYYISYAYAHFGSTHACAGWRTQSSSDNVNAGKQQQPRRHEQGPTSWGCDTLYSEENNQAVGKWMFSWSNCPW